MRLDKYLSEIGLGSRKEVKKFIKQGLVEVNDTIQKSDKFQVDPEKDQVKFDGEPLSYQEFYYYVLNKPQGVVSATEDYRDPTVMDLFEPQDFRSDLFPVGRLDKDTEGFLLITNDGKLAHRLLSPKKHVDKEYYVETAGVMTTEDQRIFQEGISLDKEKTLPAELKILETDEANGTSKIQLILQEGKFHQVKRMVAAVGKEVVYLKRIRMGGLFLPQDIELGTYRELTAAELSSLIQGKAEE